MTILTLTIFILSTSSVTYLTPVHAARYSVNSVRNGDFEGGVDTYGLPIYWGNATHDCNCQPLPTITANDTEAISGNGARLDIGQTGIGFMGMFQSYPQNTFLSSFNESANELDFWFRLDPKYAGLGDFQIKFLAQNAQELDYVIDPDPQLSYPNQTATICYSPCSDPVRDALPNQPSVKYIFLGSLNNQPPMLAPPSTWVHFKRDITADWLAPMKFSNNSTCTPASPCMLGGFPLDDVFTRIEFDNIGFRDPTNPVAGGYFGMIVWIDNVNLYRNSDTPPPPPPPKHFLEFNFTDLHQNTIVDQYVKWQIFNATGNIGQYTRGAQTLPDATYTLNVYYPTFTGQNPEPYLIYQNRIPFDTNLTITLAILAEPLSPSTFVAFSPAVLDTTSIQQDTNTLGVNVKTSSGTSYKIVAQTPVKPKAIVKTTSTRVELAEGTDWTFDVSLSTVTIKSLGQALYTIYLQQPIRIPNISFTDRTGTEVSNLLTFNMTNSRGTGISISPGQITPDENYPYYLRAYYQGHRIYYNTVDLSKTTPIELEMLPISNGYLAINSTVAGINNIQQSSVSFTFDLTGTGPFLILVHVSQKPLYVEINGARTADWVYDSAVQTAIIETSSQGTIALFFTPLSTQPPPGDSSSGYSNYIIAATILAGSIIGAAVLGLYLRRRQREEADNSQQATGKTGNKLSRLEEPIIRNHGGGRDTSEQY